MYIVMFDALGDGWNGAEYSVYSIPLGLGRLDFGAPGDDDYYGGSPGGGDDDYAGNATSTEAGATTSSLRATHRRLSMLYTVLTSALPRIAVEYFFLWEPRFAAFRNTPGSAAAVDNRKTYAAAASGGEDRNSTMPPGYQLVSRGTLENGQTGYVPLCLTDGCYTAGVSPGTHPEEVAWVLCGAIAMAGMQGYFRVSLAYLKVVNNYSQSMPVLDA
jgi:hypothetical protein